MPVRRATVNRVLDRIRFFVDTRPALPYQPLPWLDLHTARRETGVQTRWDAMVPVIDDVRAESAVDVGCNVGYYTIMLGRKGIPTVGIESNRRYVRILMHAIAELQLENVGTLNMQVTPETAALVPRTDCILLLSVWHHIVRERGLDAATSVLARIWSHAAKVLFFETGETEMPDSYGLPEMKAGGRAYLSEYLAATCEAGEVRHLGAHELAAGSRYYDENARRNLFAIVRSRD